MRYRETETMKCDPSHAMFSATSTVILLSSLTGLAIAVAAKRNTELKKSMRMMMMDSNYEPPTSQDVAEREVFSHARNLVCATT